jgi:hypothetical protein
LARHVLVHGQNYDSNLNDIFQQLGRRCLAKGSLENNSILLETEKSQKGA